MFYHGLLTVRMQISGVLQCGSERIVVGATRGFTNL
jgi:hypothetical protein